MASDFGRQINAILAKYKVDVLEEIDEAQRETAEEAVEILEATAPVRSGKYSKSFTYTKENGEYVLHSKKPYYRLTHLLEWGHDVVRNGVKVGEAAPRPHWANAEKEAIKRLEDKFK